MRLDITIRPKFASGNYALRLTVCHDRYDRYDIECIVFQSRGVVCPLTLDDHVRFGNGGEASVQRVDLSRGQETL